MRTMSLGQLKVGSLVFGGVRAIGIAGPPTNGSTGTGAGSALPGSLCQDKTNGVSYVNVGTKAAPVWSPVSPVTVAVTSANILAMNGASVNLIAAPPAGYCVIIDNILVEMVRTSTQYASGGVVTFIYTGSVAAHTGSLPASVVTGAAGTVLTQLGPATGANGTTVPTATGIDITNATAAFTTGTGTMKVFFDYRILPQ